MAAPLAGALGQGVALDPSLKAEASESVDAAPFRVRCWIPAVVREPPPTLFLTPATWVATIADTLAEKGKGAEGE